MKNPLEVLIVDDDRDGAEGLADLVAVFGHHSHVAYSGADAVSASAQEDFDLTFMDLHMPGMNGVEAILNIRKTKPHAKIVLITGRYDGCLLQESSNNGILRVLQKPVDLREVLSALEAIRA